MIVVVPMGCNNIANALEKARNVKAAKSAQRSMALKGFSLLW